MRRGIAGIKQKQAMQAKKQALGAEIEMIVMDSYDNSLKFDQCDCSGSSACKLTNGTRPVIDIGKYVDFWKNYDGITLPYVILVFLLLIIMYVVVESIVGKQISMQRFILGPGIEKNDNEGQCDLIFKTFNQLT